MRLNDGCEMQFTVESTDAFNDLIRQMNEQSMKNLFKIGNRFTVMKSVDWENSLKIEYVAPVTCANCRFWEKEHGELECKGIGYCKRLDKTYTPGKGYCFWGEQK